MATGSPGAFITAVLPQPDCKRLIASDDAGLEYSTVEASRGFVVTRTLMTICGAADVLLLSLLSVIGERESGDIHVILFAGFAAASYVYFICVCLLTRWTFTGSQSDIWRKRLQRTFLASVTITIPVIIALFTLYNGFCVPFTYELFAVFEYATVLAMYAFHVCSLPKMTGHVYVFHSSIKSRTQRV
ncbi:hypothetical protein TELCIR_01897 [Teladorsagia circumcincta]|uniref:CWH43-like N-terminal domain-containing protein n=1 Tax=Teladorsagia circumcincta TaxID=45464 RepID=A0A2G9V0L9_TELCI|nr:hypothetical protein TELCIR_01897 [Teladorsagia circumcincta]